MSICQIVRHYEFLLSLWIPIGVTTVKISSLSSRFFSKRKGKKKQEGIFHDPTGMKSDFRTNGLSLVLDLIIFINENERNNDERGAID